MNDGAGDYSTSVTPPMPLCMESFHHVTGDIFTPDPRGLISKSPTLPKLKSAKLVYN